MHTFRYNGYSKVNQKEMAQFFSSYLKIKEAVFLLQTQKFIWTYAYLCMSVHQLKSTAALPFFFYFLNVEHNKETVFT